MRRFCLSVLCVLACGGVHPPAALAQHVDLAELKPPLAAGLEGRPPLGSVLLQIARQHDLDLLFAPDVVGGRTVSDVLAGHSPSKTLELLVEAAGLELRRLPSGTFVVEEAPAPLARLDGSVADALTGEPLEGVHVYVVGGGAGTATDAEGRFTLNDLPPGGCRLVASHVSYGSQAATIVVPPEGGAHRFALVPAAIPFTRPIVVQGTDELPPFDALRLREAAGVLHTRGYGTPDAVRSLNTLLGVRVSDALADVHVQGGESGDHQFQLDGVPLFEPVHLRGLFGSFNPFALEQITVHKAGFRVEHGSHLAGVIQAEHALHNPEGRRLDVQADPLSLNGRLHGGRRWGGARWDWMVAARTSVWGAAAGPLQSPLRELLRAWNTPDPFIARATLLAVVSQNPDLGESVSGLTDEFEFVARSTPELGFNDVHASTELRLGQRHLLGASAYRGGNRLNGNQLVLPAEPFGARPAGRTAQRDRYAWSNVASQVQHRWLLGAAAVLTTRLRAGRYRLSHEYTTLEEGVRVLPFLTRDGRIIPFRPVEDVRPADDGNGVTEVAVESGIRAAPHPAHSLHLGVEAIQTQHRFLVEDAYLQPIASDGRQSRLAAFLEHTWVLGRGVSAAPGVRLTYLGSSRQAYAEPRLRMSARRSATWGTWHGWLATGLYRQFLNQFNLSSVSPSALFPSTRFWLPVDSTVSPPRALHLTAGAEARPTPRLLLQAEAYHKRTPHLLSIDYARLSRQPSDAPARPVMQADFLAGGQARASGFSVGGVWRSTRAQVQGRYEREHARRTRTLAPAQPAPLAIAAEAAAPEAWEAVPWNVPHRAEVAVDLRPSDAWTMSVRGRALWQRRWAFRRSYYHYLATGEGPVQPVFGAYDLRRPDQHALPPLVQIDVATAYTHTFGPLALQLRADLLNALGRENQADWSLEEVDPSFGEPSFRTVPRYLVPRLPSVAIRARW